MTTPPDTSIFTDLVNRRIDRRTFVTRATALGLSSSAIASLLAACGGEETDATPTTPAEPPVEGELTEQVELTTQPGDNQVRIAFDLPSQAQLRWRFDQQFFQEAVDELGDEVVFQNANDDEALQANQVENFLNQLPDVLVIVPINVAATASLAEMAASQQVPLISYNNVILNSSGVTWWVARDNVEVGHLTADLAIEAKPRGNYVIASGDAGTDIAQDKTKGYMERLQPLIDGGDITVVSQQFNRAWDPARGQQQVEDALTATNNDIAAILCNYDGFALAALQLLREQNLAGEVWVGGEDVFPEAGQAIVEGRMAMSSYTDLRQMARLAAQAAHELGNGREPQANDSFDNGGGEIPGVRVNSFAVTEDNMCQFIKETQWLEYEETYANVPESERPEC